MSINRKIYIFLVFFIFIGLSCDEAIELPSPDTTPPIASFIYPLDGDVVAGNYSIKVRAVDNEGVYKVDFYLNQNLVGTDSFPDGDIFKYEWNTLEIDSSTNQLLFAEDAFHYLSFVAGDINDNEFASYAIRAFIDNEDNENTEKQETVMQNINQGQINASQSENKKLWGWGHNINNQNK